MGEGKNTQLFYYVQTSRVFLRLAKASAQWSHRCLSNVGPGRPWGCLCPVRAGLCDDDDGGDEGLHNLGQTGHTGAEQGEEDVARAGGTAVSQRQDPNFPSPAAPGHILTPRAALWPLKRN